MTGSLPGRLPAPLRGALWMVGALSSFSLMAISVRELSSTMSAAQILFLRSFVSVVLVVAVLPFHGLAPLRTRRLGLHVVRNLVHFGGQYAWIYAIGLLPLATVFAIEFTMPVWTALLAMLLLGERLNRGRIVMMVAGITGILIILRPGAAPVSHAAVVMLAGAFAYGAALVATKRLAGSESVLAILFYMSVIQAPIALVPALSGWVTPVLRDAPWIFATGICGLTAHFCMTRAFRLADATLVVPIDFLRLPLIAIVGAVVYSEPVEATTFIGAAVIFAGTYYSLRRESRLP
ncbi:MAG TPA: DMT family transporter [Burkholderiales bacterium]|nr:DMT family transporter [Burkholderiales bacterium]